MMGTREAGHGGVDLGKRGFGAAEVVSLHGLLARRRGASGSSASVIRRRGDGEVEEPRRFGQVEGGQDGPLAPGVVAERCAACPSPVARVTRCIRVELVADVAKVGPVGPRDAPSRASGNARPQQQATRSQLPQRQRSSECRSRCGTGTGKEHRSSTASCCTTPTPGQYTSYPLHRARRARGHRTLDRHGRRCLRQRPHGEPDRSVRPTVRRNSGEHVSGPDAF